MWFHFKKWSLWRRQKITLGKIISRLIDLKIIKKLIPNGLESSFPNIELETLKAKEQLDDEQSQVDFIVSDKDNPVSDDSTDNLRATAYYSTFIASELIPSPDNLFTVLFSRVDQLM